MLNSCSEYCSCVWLTLFLLCLVGMSTNKLFNNKTNSDNFLKDFLKSNESKIDKVRQENVMINCECSCGLNYCVWVCTFTNQF